MISHCDATASTNTAQRAEYARVRRQVARYGALAKIELNPWETSHQLRDAFFIREARCDGRFHLYEASLDGKVFERTAIDCPRWRLDAERREAATL